MRQRNSSTQPRLRVDRPCRHRAVCATGSGAFELEMDRAATGLVDSDFRVCELATHAIAMIVRVVTRLGLPNDASCRSTMLNVFK